MNAPSNLIRFKAAIAASPADERLWTAVAEAWQAMKSAESFIYYAYRNSESVAGHVEDVRRAALNVLAAVNEWELANDCEPMPRGRT